MLEKLRSFGRIKPKYRPLPNAVEQRHEARLRLHGCIGCGSHNVELHHTMLPVPGKIHRRDHRFQIPVCAECHRGRNGIHGCGSEAKWGERMGLDTAQIALDLWLVSERNERRGR